MAALLLFFLCLAKGENPKLKNLKYRILSILEPPWRAKPIRHFLRSSQGLRQ